MLESLPVILIVGTALGFLAGIGVGGGSLLILWLTLILNMDYAQARFINLMFFLPTAIVSSLFRWRQGSLELKTVLPAIVSGCVAAGFCAYFSSYLEINILKKLFGCLLIATGIRELIYKPTKKERP